MAFGETVNSSESSDSDDSSSSGGLFTFEKRAFNSGKQPTTTSTSDDENISDDDSLVAARSTSRFRGGNKRKSPPSVEERLSALKHRKRPSVPSTDNLSDDDSDVVEVVGKAPAPKATKATREVEILSSDDDDDVVEVPSRKGCVRSFASADAEGLKAFQRARDAKRKLLAAQSYHAEDIRVAAPPPPNRPVYPMVAALGYEQLATGYAAARTVNPVDGLVNSALPANVYPMPQNNLYPAQGALSHGAMAMGGAKMPVTGPANLGKTIMLSLRTQEYVNGKLKQASSNVHLVIAVKEHESLHQLLEKYLKARDLDSESTRVEFTFDGEKLDLTKTPASYELENEDLVDAVARTIVIPTKPHRSPACGPEMMLTLRVQETKGGKKVVCDVQDVLSIRLLEPLSVLVKKLKKKRKLKPATRITMTFDGTTLDPNKNPKDYEMEDEDLIDVIVK